MKSIFRLIVALCFFGIVSATTWAAPATKVLPKSWYRPVGMVLDAPASLKILEPDGRKTDAFPTRMIRPGQKIVLANKDRLVVWMLNGTSQVTITGPQTVHVRDQHLSVRRSDPPMRWSKLDPDNLELLQQWIKIYPRSPRAHKEPSIESDRVEALMPAEGAVLLTRHPEFIFRGEVPEDSSLILYDAQGKRFWVEPVDGFRVAFPSAAVFQWGDYFTWELRKSTGGKVLTGAFSIASEATARQLYANRLPAHQTINPIDQLFAGMRAQLAGAFHEADRVWVILGVTRDKSGLLRRQK